MCSTGTKRHCEAPEHPLAPRFFINVASSAAVQLACLPKNVGAQCCRGMPLTRSSLNASSASSSSGSPAASH